MSLGPVPSAHWPWQVLGGRLHRQEPGLSLPGLQAAAVQQVSVAAGWLGQVTAELQAGVWTVPRLLGTSPCACVYSSDPTLRAMWPDGQQDITEVTKRPLTAGTIFKNSMVALVENLASKVPWAPPPRIPESPPCPALSAQCKGRIWDPRVRLGRAGSHWQDSNLTLHSSHCLLGRRVWETTETGNRHSLSWGPGPRSEDYSSQLGWERGWG